jgi:hypothetical protein
MERELRIYEMSDTTDTTALARLWLLHERFPREYVATRVRPSSFPRSLATHQRDLDSCLLAEGDRGRRTIRSTDAPASGGRSCHAAA